MASILDLVNPIKGVLDVVGGIVGKFVPDPAEKAQAQLQMFEAMSNLQTTLLQLNQDFAATQAQVITAEANSTSWLTKSWRPIVMLCFASIIIYNFVFSPIFHLPASQMPPDLWALLKLGIGGYIGGRTIEKTVPQVAGLFAPSTGSASTDQ